VNKIKIYPYHVNLWKLPLHRNIEYLGWFADYPSKDCSRKFVFQRHKIGKSQHGDIRLEKCEFLEGLSIVGFSQDQPISPQVLLQSKGKGFRAETKCIQEHCNEWMYDIEEREDGFYSIPINKEELSFRNIEELARQPKVWLKVKGEIKPGQVGGGVEAPGHFEILDLGTYWEGAIKPWFKEFFLKGRTLTNYVRVIVRAVKVRKIDPKTKQPIEGQFERMWRFMIPKDQTAYAIGNRARKEGWKPPAGIIPVPPNQRKGEQYESWLKWIKGKEEKQLQAKTIPFVLGLHKYRGPVHVRGIFILDWYLLFDTKRSGSPKAYKIEGDPTRESGILSWDWGRVSRKFLDWEGQTKPRSTFNPNKKLVGEYKILDKGTVSFNRYVENKEVRIDLQFKGKSLKGKWKLIQEEPGSESYSLDKLSKLELSTGKFILDRHEYPINGGVHFDLRWYIKGDSFDEVNLFQSPFDKAFDPIIAVKKTGTDMSWMDIKPKGTKKKAYGKISRVDTVDHGTIEIIEDNPNFISMNIKGKQLKGLFALKKKNKLWNFIKSAKPGEYREKKELQGNPKTGDFLKPFNIEEKKGWNYFYIYLYDIRRFTRCISPGKVKDYLPNINIPSGVTVSICLYNRPDKLHGARVGYIKFNKDGWSYDKATSWIKSNKLHTFESTQIRFKNKGKDILTNNINNTLEGDCLC